ncbi:restriction endonuclease subunit S [Saccharopolyspora taberi]|uniref:Type I restriction modification DNA specificity domain-containing protein n=1 Tax=Saccharopolyspora taberi TaxID=60895 RepID=A0ABN3V883_9PSEU
MSDLPTGWEWTTLGEIAEVRLGRQRSPKNHNGSQMRPYLRAANVGWDGLKLDDVKEMNFTDDEAETYQLRSGDIVLSEASGSASEVGKPAMWNGEIDGCCFQNTLIRVRPSKEVDPRFLLLFLKGEALRGAFVEHSRGVGIHHLGAARLTEWHTPLPSLAEQRRIVASLEGYLSRVDAGIGILRKIGNLSGAEGRAEQLRRSLLRESFAGRLVEQDPTDEPASLLLERIRAERESASKVKRARKSRAKAAVPARESKTDRSLPEPNKQDALDLGL